MTSIWGINGCKGHISIISVSYQYHISIISVSYQHMGNPAGGTMKFTSPWGAARKWVRVQIEYCQNGGR